jgi:hypothetical protein
VHSHSGLLASQAVVVPCVAMMSRTILAKFEGIYQLTNTTGPNAIKYIHVGISDDQNAPVSL